VRRGWTGEQTAATVCSSVTFGHLARIRSGTAAPPKAPWLWRGVAGECDLKIQEVEASSRSRSWVGRRPPMLPRPGGYAAVGARDCEVKLQHAGNLAGVEATRSISITRAQNGVATILQANETTALRPGDVVETRSCSAGVCRSRTLSPRKPVFCLTKWAPWVPKSKLARPLNSDRHMTAGDRSAANHQSA
jgi:hypothetical protein